MPGISHGFAGILQVNVHDSETAPDILADTTCQNTSTTKFMSSKEYRKSEEDIPNSTLGMESQNVACCGEKTTLTQLPMIVATVAACGEKFFVICRYVGYKSCTRDVSRRHS